MGVDVYYGTVCYRNYKKGQLYFGDCVFVSGSEKFTTRELYCEKSKVGIIRLLQTPADRKLNTCKIKITVRSENADSVKIKNVYADEALKQINEAYNLNLNV